MAYVLPTAIGAANIAVMLAAGWFIGGAVAGLMGERSPDAGDRIAALSFAIMAAALTAVLLFVAYGIGAAIMDVLR